MPDDTLELTLTRRLREVVDGAAATEGELRLLTEQAEGLARSLAAAIAGSEAQLTALMTEHGSSVAAMAAELRRVERLRDELDDLRADLRALGNRARTLRGAWARPNA
jgi:hypothetical protein